jgi:endogenous inhibitor of DNA gyrase (YacG/DUF329 family)
LIDLGEWADEKYAVPDEHSAPPDPKNPEEPEED